MVFSRVSKISSELSRSLKEDLTKIDNKEFFEALTYMGFKIPAKMLEKIHINDKYPEYKNECEALHPGSILTNIFTIYIYSYIYIIFQV